MAQRDSICYAYTVPKQLHYVPLYRIGWFDSNERVSEIDDNQDKTADMKLNTLNTA